MLKNFINAKKFEKWWKMLKCVEKVKKILKNGIKSKSCE